MALPTSELFNRYYFSEVLGEGQSGRIWRCLDRITGETVACKQVRKRGKSLVELADLRREVQAMLILRGHPNVLCLRGLYEDDKAVYMVTELCAGGDIFALIADNEGLEESAAARLFVQIARAVRWCHVNRVVHRDIKPENILLVHPTLPADSAADSPSSPRPRDMEIRLADFGLAFPLQPGSAIIGAAGSAPYEAPEVLAHEPYNYCADIWSLGVLLFAILSANWPAFPDDKRKLLPSDLLPKPWPSISFEAKDLVRRMLTVDPMDRIDIIGVLEHPWFQKHLAPPPLSLSAAKPQSQATAQSQRPVAMKRPEASNAVAAPRELSVVIAAEAESPKSEPVSPTSSESPGEKTARRNDYRNDGETQGVETTAQRPKSVATKLAEIPRSASDVLAKSTSCDRQGTVAATPGRSRRTRRSRLQQQSPLIKGSHLSSCGDTNGRAGESNGCGGSRHSKDSSVDRDGDVEDVDGNRDRDGESRPSSSFDEMEGELPSPSSPPSKTPETASNVRSTLTSGRGWCEVFEQGEGEADGACSSILSCHIIPGRKSRFRNLEVPPLPQALSLSSCSSVSSGSDL